MALILVVDDEPQVRALIDLVLKDEHLIILAESGQRALDLLKLARPNLIILDIKLDGGLSGLDTCRAIRSIPALAGVPILAMSGYADRGEVSDIESLGANSFLNKPFSPPELQVRVQQMIELDAVSIGRLLAGLGEYKLVEAVKLALQEGHSLQITRALKQAIAEVNAEVASDGS